MVVTFFLPLLATDFSHATQIFIALVTLCFAVAVLPDASAFARRNRRFRSVLVQFVVTFPLIISSVGADLFNRAWHVFKQVWQDFGVADVVGAGHGAEDFQRRFVHAQMQLEPGATVAPAVLTDFPFAFAVDFDAGRIHHQMTRL